MTTPHNSRAPELLPCPFCNGDAVFEQDRSDGPRSLRWSAGCRKETCMGYMGPTFPRRKDALEAWNSRAPAAALEGLENLRSALANCVSEMKFARKFVNSRQIIKQPEGRDGFDDAIAFGERALLNYTGQPPPSEPSAEDAQPDPENVLRRLLEVFSADVICERVRELAAQRAGEKKC